MSNDDVENLHDGVINAAADQELRIREGGTSISRY